MRLRVLLWVTLSLFVSSALGAASLDVKARADLAEDAERAYRAGDYARAKERWLELLAERGADGRIEYDLGNCEYRLGDPARALWRFERAKRALGADERVRFNLTLAERALGLERPEASSFFADFGAWFARLDRAACFGYGLAFEVLGLVLLALGLRLRARALVVSAVVLIFVGVAGLVRCATLDDARILGGIVLEEGTKVRAEPREALAPTMRLGAGVRVEHLASSPQWVRIRYDGREGWMPRARVGLY